MLRVALSNWLKALAAGPEEKKNLSHEPCKQGITPTTWPESKQKQKALLAPRSRRCMAKRI